MILKKLPNNGLEIAEFMSGLKNKMIMPSGNLEMVTTLYSSFLKKIIKIIFCNPALLGGVRGW